MCQSHDERSFLCRLFFACLVPRLSRLSVSPNRFVAIFFLSFVFWDLLLLLLTFTLLATLTFWMCAVAHDGALWYIVRWSGRAVSCHKLVPTDYGADDAFCVDVAPNMMNDLQTGFICSFRVGAAYSVSVCDLALAGFGVD